MNVEINSTKLDENNGLFSLTNATDKEEIQ